MPAPVSDSLTASAVADAAVAAAAEPALAALPSAAFGFVSL